MTNEPIKLTSTHIWSVLSGLAFLARDRELASQTLGAALDDAAWERLSGDPIRFYIFAPRAVRRPIAAYINENAPGVYYGHTFHRIEGPVPGLADDGFFRGRAHSIETSADFCGWEGAKIVSVEFIEDERFRIDLVEAEGPLSGKDFEERYMEDFEEKYMQAKALHDAANA